MYISIDMDKMRFLHKHTDVNTVCNLDFIAKRSCSVGPTDYPDLFRHMTDQELGLLYKHSTNTDHIPGVGDTLRMVLAELAERFPVTDVDPAEAEVQAAWLEAKHKDGVAGYVYVKGARVPRRTDDVLFPDPVPALTPEDAAAAVRKHTARAQQRARAVPAATPAPATSTPQRAARTPAPARRPQSGAGKEIWEALDAELARTGEIPSRTRILELSAQHGWNPNTGSAQGAAWKRAQRSS